MGTEVPDRIKQDWTGCAAHYWRLGVLDALKQISQVHDLSAEMSGWAAAERIDRMKRAQWRKKP
jgi:hypothetical protein